MYRLVALLSLARKMIESAIAMMVRKIHKFRDGQLKVRQVAEMETAKLKHLIISELIGVAAVVGRKAVYDSVPRRRSFAVIEKR